MRRTCSTGVLSAVMIMTAFGLAGCQDNPDAPAAPPPPVASSPMQSSIPASPGAPLPAPEALVDVMVRLSDPAVDGAAKLGLIDMSTPGDVPALNKFRAAVNDSRMQPLSFEARDITWAGSEGGNVTANVVIHPTAAGDFTFPFEFSRAEDGSWRLSRQTADMLLDFATEPPAPPTSSPSPPSPAPPTPPR